MAQSPFQVDALQIEPGSGDTITISRGAGGDLEFVDANTSALALQRLAGMAANAAVLVVGSNCQYTTIQDALDAVPATSGAGNPHVILVTPGVYAENLTIQKDGVTLMGLGSPSITAAAGDAVTISEAVSTVPRFCTLSGLRVSSSQDNSSCIRIIGGAGSEVGEGRILLQDLELLPSGAGSRSLKAETAGNIICDGGDWSDEDTTYVEVSQCASVVLKGLRNLSDVSISHSSDAALSSSSTVGYILEGCDSVGNVLATLTGESSLTLSNCSSVGDVTLAGDQSNKILSSIVGDLTLNNTASVTVTASSHGTLAGDGSHKGSVVGSATFDNEAFVDVTFDVSQTDDQYVVCTDTEMTSTFISVLAKTVDGFRIQLDGPSTGTVGWVLLRG